MKKPLLCLIALAIFFSGCATKHQSPEQVAIDFFNVLYNEHDIEKAEAYCTEESKEKLKTTIRAIEGAMQIIDASNQTTYKYSVIKEQSKIENDSALMVVKSSLDSTQMKLMLVKINDEWKVDFNYEEPVIQKELIDEVLEIMKPFSDSITVQKE